MTATAQHTLEDGPAIVADVDSTAVATRSAQFQLALDLENAGCFKTTALDLPPDATYEQREALANYLGQIKRRSSWWIGDLLVESENRDGELYAQVAHATGLSEQTLLNLVYVSKHVPRERRREKLPHSVHAEVASLSAKEQKHWLDKAEKHAWTRSELRDAMKAKRRDERPTLTDDDDVPPGSLQEVALAILRDATPLEDGQHHQVPNEDIVRLRAALGQEDDANPAAQAEAE